VCFCVKQFLVVFFCLFWFCSSSGRKSRELRSLPRVDQEREFAQWQLDIADLASKQNVYAKLSGLTMIFQLPIRDYYDNRRTSVEVR